MAPMGAVMMVAMMLPSAAPLVVGQAGRPWAASAAIAIYVVAWSAIGVPALLFASMLPAAPIGLAVIVVLSAAAYGFTPLQRASRERCRALCAERLPALELGLNYCLGCIGCSAGVMVALLVVGPMNPLWMLLASVAVAAYKAPVRMERGSPSLGTPS